MRLIVRSLAAVAFAAGMAACGDSPTQPQDLAAKLQGHWVYVGPPTNNPGGGNASFSLDLVAQGTTVSGTAIKSWLGPTTFAMTGTLTGGTVALDGTGLISGVTPAALHFRGTMLGGDLLLGTMTEDAEGGSGSIGLMFRKSP
jgi:hypothetical protein